MSGLTTYGSAAIRGGTALPQTLYARLHTADPGSDGTASPAVEATRVAVDLHEHPTIAHTTSNDAAATWSGVASTEVVTFLVLWDAATDGNAWAIADIEPAVELVAAGDATIETDRIRILLVPHGAS